MRRKILFFVGMIALNGIFSRILKLCKKVGIYGTFLECLCKKKLSAGKKTEGFDKNSVPWSYEPQLASTKSPRKYACYHRSQLNYLIILMENPDIFNSPISYFRKSLKTIQIHSKSHQVVLCSSIIKFQQSQPNSQKVRF